MSIAAINDFFKSLDTNETLAKEFVGRSNHL